MAGCGFSFYLGWQVTGVHNILPFLLIGIGVDDMFVIVNAVDQTDTRLSVTQRIKLGYAHAGPSITITSFTNAIAFFTGTTTSLEALKSFCFFAGFCIIMLYISVLTLFSAVFVCDLRRQKARKADCICCRCCKEDSWICCFAYFLSD